MRAKFTTYFTLIISLYLISLMPHAYAQSGSDNPEPYCPLRYNYRTATFNDQGEMIVEGEMSEIAERAFSEAKAALDKIAANDILHSQRNFQNTAEAMEHVMTQLYRTIFPLEVLQYLALGPVSDEAAVIDEKSKAFVIENSLRKDLHDAFQAFLKNRRGDFSSLDEDKRTIVENLQIFMRKSGVHLEGEAAQLNRDLRHRLNAVEVEYMQNLNKNNKPVLFTQTELDGVPQECMKNLPQNSSHGTLYYSVNPNDFNNFKTITEDATCLASREKIEVAWLNRGGPENTALALEAGQIRDQIAKLTGYASWEDYQADGRMLKNAGDVKQFLDTVSPEIISAHQKLIDELQKLKDADLTARPGPILYSDISYYAQKLKKKRFTLDPIAIRKYFTAEQVFQGALQFYSKLYGVTIRGVQNVDVWHPTVKVYQVSDSETGEHLGTFPVDLYYREGKGNNMLVSMYSPPGINPDGSYQRPKSILLGNLPDPSQGLSLDGVRKIWHEIGHKFHIVCTKAKYSSIAGTNVTFDILEVPSTLSEKLMWRSEALDLIAPDLPHTLRQELMESFAIDETIRRSKYLFYSRLDYEVHTNPNQDPETLTRRLTQETRGVPLPAAATEVLSTFYTMMVGYDGGFHTYLSSEETSKIFVSVFDREGLPSAGMKYRNTFLAPGGSKPPRKIIDEFNTPNTAVEKNPIEQEYDRFVRDHATAEFDVALPLSDENPTINTTLDALQDREDSLILKFLTEKAASAPEADLRPLLNQLAQNIETREASGRILEVDDSQTNILVLNRLIKDYGLDLKIIAIDKTPDDTTGTLVLGIVRSQFKTSNGIQFPKAVGKDIDSAAIDSTKLPKIIPFPIPDTNTDNLESDPWWIIFEECFDDRGNFREDFDRGRLSSRLGQEVTAETVQAIRSQEPTIKSQITQIKLGMLSHRFNKAHHRDQQIETAISNYAGSFRDYFLGREGAELILDALDGKFIDLEKTLKELLDWRTHVDFAVFAATMPVAEIQVDHLLLSRIFTAKESALRSFSKHGLAMAITMELTSIAKDLLSTDSKQWADVFNRHLSQENIVHLAGISGSFALSRPVVKSAIKAGQWIRTGTTAASATPATWWAKALQEVTIFTLVGLSERYVLPNIDEKLLNRKKDKAIQNAFHHIDSQDLIAADLESVEEIFQYRLQSKMNVVLAQIQSAHHEITETIEYAKKEDPYDMRASKELFEAMTLPMKSGIVFNDPIQSYVQQQMHSKPMSSSEWQFYKQSAMDHAQIVSEHAWSRAQHDISQNLSLLLPQILELFKEQEQILGELLLSSQSESQYALIEEAQKRFKMEVIIFSRTFENLS